MHNFPSQYQAKDGIFAPCGSDTTEAPFLYTDGEDFELKIQSIIAGASDRSLFSPEIRSAIWDWRSSCHLSPVRANILRPLELKRAKRVLELGSGCGIITRYLGELGSDVVALEASALRAAITRQRTADLHNVKVVCDRIENFNADEKFDLVTMIGVLQYARMFSTCGEHAEVDLLRRAAGQLNDDGVLVIAIQNKLGLKYFSGFPESNAEVPFFGIEDQYGPSSIIRFGLEELGDLLNSVGLDAHDVLLPLPDYHMPASILSPMGSGPSPHFSGDALLALSAGRDRARPDWKVPSFSLEKAWESIYRNGLAPQLANSFLIIAGRSDKALSFLHQSPDFAWHFSVERHPAFVTAKTFSLNGDRIEVKRRYLAPQPAPDLPVKHHLEDEVYLQGSLWWSSLVKIVNTPGWSTTDFCNWARRWLDAVSASAQLGPALSLSLDKEIPGSMFDWTPLNCIESQTGALQFIDKEWEIKSSLTLGYLVLRGLFGSLASIASCAIPIEGTPLKILDLIRDSLRLQSIAITDEQVEKFIAQESSIQHWINNGSEGVIAEEWITYVKEAKLVERLDASHLRLRLEAGESKLAEQEQLIEQVEQALRDSEQKRAELEARLHERLTSRITRMFANK